MGARLRARFAVLRRQLSMPSSYQGSVVGYLFGRANYNVRLRFKALRQRLRAAPGTDDPALAEHLSRYREGIAHRDWDEVLRQALAIAPIAEAKRDAALMAEMGAALHRLRAYSRSVELTLKSRQIRRATHDKEWRGDDLSDRVLLVDFTEQANTSMGAVLHAAPLIARAAQRSRRCIVLVERRLAPLLQRSFTGIEVRVLGVDDDATRAEADVVATIEHLLGFLARNEQEIAASFVPLRADPTLTAEFRTGYRTAYGAPLVGISWASKSYSKDLPSLTEWVRLLRSIDATFVSLQYGKVAGDLAKLQRNNPRTIVHDASVDQLVDMDRFAAQVAALDAVLSISNTGAHLAGALAVPSVIIVDDRFRTVWPVIGDTTPWYPQVRLVGKRGRTWDIALQEVRAGLHARIGIPE